MDNEKNTSEKTEEKIQDQKLEGVSGGRPALGEIKTLGQERARKCKKGAPKPKKCEVWKDFGAYKDKGGNDDLDFKF